MEVIVVWLVISAIILSSFFISRKVFKTLKSKNNPYYELLAIVCFIVSIFVITIAVFISWILLGGGFSRR